MFNMISYQAVVGLLLGDVAKQLGSNAKNFQKYFLALEKVLNSASYPRTNTNDSLTITKHEIKT